MPNDGSPSSGHSLDRRGLSGMRSGCDARGSATCWSAIAACPSGTISRACRSSPLPDTGTGPVTRRTKPKGWRGSPPCRLRTSSRHVSALRDASRSARQGPEALRMRTAHPSLSVVIPAYNEDARLEPTLRDTIRYFRGRRHEVEVIVVDDGSVDRTSVLVDRLSGEFDEIRLMRLPVNRGKGYAVRTGIVNARGAQILYMDADGATPIAEIERPGISLSRQHPHRPGLSRHAMRVQAVQRPGGAGPVLADPDERLQLRRRGPADGALSALSHRRDPGQLDPSARLASQHATGPASDASRPIHHSRAHAPR